MLVHIGETKTLPKKSWERKTQEPVLSYKHPGQSTVVNSFYV